MFSNNSIIDIKPYLTSNNDPDEKKIICAAKALVDSYYKMLEDVVLYDDIDDYIRYNDWNVLKPILTYLFYSTKISDHNIVNSNLEHSDKLPLYERTNTKNKLIKTWYIHIDLYVGNKISIPYVDSFIDNTKFDYDYDKYNLASHMCKYIRQYEPNNITIIKKYTRLGYAEAMKSYLIDVSIDDIIQYISNNGSTSYISCKMAEQLQISRSPRIFELAWYNLADDDYDSQYLSILQYDLVYKFLNHTHIPPTFEMRLLLNRYLISGSCYYHTVTDSENIASADAALHNMTHSFTYTTDCKFCNNSNIYKDECTNYYNQLHILLRQSLEYSIDINNITDIIYRYI